jgi:hypothetical protein
MKPTEPNTTSPQTIWDAESQPDVAWGDGGIDDWGWTAQASSSETDRPPASSSTPPKEPQHVL